MAGVSTLGIGSGLKLSDILDKLTSAEKQVLAPVSKQQSAATGLRGSDVKNHVMNIIDCLS
ncbi:hypothetical protein BBB56_20740 [Candidatus Pantoea deserta]|uniref:Uncharacterized protein n=1 Tax=Candidatus Pantoea deserta TaxID=1869313 RepID=A0A3N4NN40_9GAMM|nr:hypothetical protein [Pantoea deserta]RPD94566.1 hypothetical protein BBB56_20740 [Pantoea deserta]